MQLRFSDAAQRAGSHFSALSIGRRVALVGLVPGIVALGLAGAKLVRDYETWSLSRTAAAEIAAAGQVGALVHELQSERGLSISASARGDAANSAQLAQQRAKVDAQRKLLAERLAELGEESREDAIVAGIDSLQNRLCNIESLRKAIDARTVAPGDVAAYYSAPVDDYIRYVERAGTTDASLLLRDRLIGFSALLRAKEAAALERGVGAGAIAAGQLDGETRDTILKLVATQTTYATILAEHAPPALASALLKFNSAPTTKAALAMRDRLLASPVPDAASGEAWWAAMSARVDALQGVSRQVEDDLVAIAQADARAAQASFFVFALLALIFGAALTALVMAVARGLVRPVQTLAAVTDRMASGDLAVDVPIADTGEEIGQLGASIRQFRDRLLTAEAERAAHTEERERQLARIEERARRVDGLTGRFDGEVGGVLATFTESTRALLEAARELDRKAIESAERSAAVASASQQTNANVRLVAEATEELSLSIEEIVRQVTVTAQGMADAVAEVRRAHGDMALLRQAAGEIGSIVTTIGDIAEQTNILALNATIEAARAGQEGLGFAVVANEVRALAVETGDATRSIAGSIAAMTSKTRAAADGMDRIAEVIRAAEQSSTAISAALEQQSMAARQIAENVQEAACGVAQVDSNIVAIEQASSAQRGEVEGVLGAANVFGERASSLDASVKDFLTSIRAA